MYYESGIIFIHHRERLILLTLQDHIRSRRDRRTQTTTVRIDTPTEPSRTVALLGLPRAVRLALSKVRAHPQRSQLLATSLPTRERIGR
mgnify:FL=1